MQKQSTNTLLMIEPIAFGFNPQTAENNYFQQNDNTESTKLQEQALLEFNASVAKLREHDIDIIVVKDTLNPHTPDSIFPNNWVSFHDDKRIALYPMYAENRRQERRQDIIESLRIVGFEIEEIIDYSSCEKENRFLEGTGSMILDRVNHIAYAALSERTDAELFSKFCKDFGFTPISFFANQTTANNERLPIYHTNVMMCVAKQFAVVCLDSIDNKDERNKVIDSFNRTNKEIISISEEQMHQFAGNMLQVEDREGKPYLVMSETANRSLTEEQIKAIEKYNKIICLPIPTIEKYGGGSARCMLAEIFLPRK